MKLFKHYTQFWVMLTGIMLDPSLPQKSVGGSFRVFKQLVNITTRRVMNHAEVVRLRSEGASLRQVATNLGVGYGTVRLRLTKM